MYFSTPDWELTLFRWINGAWRNPLFDVAMPIISAPAFLWALAIGALILAARCHRATFLTTALSLGLTIGASDLTCSLIKDGTQRTRPYHLLAHTWYVDSGTWKQRPDVLPQTNHSGSSYPSAHAANAAAAAWILFVISHKKGIWIMPLLVGLSRIYLGKHFPTDVAAGWLTGLAVASALQPIWPEVFRLARSRWKKFRLQT